MSLRALARVNLAAIERNVVHAARPPRARGPRSAPSSRPTPPGTARCPWRGRRWPAGADSLAVATALEAAELRAAGLTVPVLIMGAVSAEELPIALEARAELVAWSEDFVDALVRRGPGAGRRARQARHRHGPARHPRMAEALSVAERVLDASAELRLAGAMTHLATADEDPEFMHAQLRGV